MNGLELDWMLTIDETGMPKAPTLKQLFDRDVSQLDKNNLSLSPALVCSLPTILIDREVMALIQDAPFSISFCYLVSFIFVRLIRLMRTLPIWRTYHFFLFSG